MTTFDEREDLFEKKFARDKELQFKLEARRAKLFGLWIAERLGLEGDAAARYAGDVVVSDLKEAGIEDILEKIGPDLAVAGVEIPEAELRVQLEEKLVVARRQLMEELG